MFLIRPSGKKIVSEYDREIPQSQTADNPLAPLNHHETPGRQIKQSNQLSLPHQDDCNTRTDIKKHTTKHRTITDSKFVQPVLICGTKWSKGLK